MPLSLTILQFVRAPISTAIWSMSWLARTSRSFRRASTNRPTLSGLQRRSFPCILAQPGTIASVNCAG